MANIIQLVLNTQELRTDVIMINIQQRKYADGILFNRPAKQAV